MAEENQVQQVTKEPQGKAAQVQRVTTKNPKKVEAGKRLAAINCKKREAKKREVKKREEQVQLERTASGVNQYYGIGAVIALRVIGGLGYYIYRTKKEQVSREVKDASMPHNPPKPHPQTNKFEMD